MFKFDVLELNQDYEIIKTREKTYQGLGKFTLSKWVRRIKSKNTLDVPKMTSFLNVTDKGTAKICQDYIGYMLFDSNTPNESQTKVSILSSTYSNGQGISLNKQNFIDCMVGFTARKLVKPDWLNARDEYTKPNTEHTEYGRFKIDSIIYSLFNNASNQSSLRQVEYKNQLWDIKNEFFWISVDEMKDLADEYNYDELYQDAHANNNRYVHTLLFGEERIYDQLSDEAKAVLDYATQLTKDSIEMRKHMANDENHLNSWDAGYAQLKLVWKEFYPERFKEFRQLYKNLEEKMRPMVYELGFLKK